MVSDVSPQFSLVLGGGVEANPPHPLRPARSHRAAENAAEEKEREEKKLVGRLKESRSRIGGEESGEDKEVGKGGVEGGREETEEIEESAIKRERNSVSLLFKLRDAQSLLLTPTCISGSLETFKLHL